MGLADLTFWERRFPADLKSKVSWDSAVNELLRGCQRAGIYDPTRQRGRGAWIDQGRIVMHLGDRLMVDGEKVDLGKFETNFIYQAGPILEAAENITPLCNKEAHKLREISNTLFWEKPIHSLYFIGWIVLAPFCGCFESRPHLWITGSAGTGKSTILEQIVWPCLGNMALPVLSATTNAGVRQTLGCDAFPVLFDEFEGEDPKARERAQSMLELARQAFSNTGSRIIKGGADGTAIDYQIRSMFLFSSILVTLARHADQTRVAIVSLNMPHDRDGLSKEEQYTDLRARITRTFTPGWCAALRARTLRLVLQIRANAELFARLISEKVDRRRGGDLYGTLLAGAYSLSSDTILTETQAREFVDKQDWSSEKEVMTSSEEATCLQTILQYRTRVDGKEISLSRLLQMLDPRPKVISAENTEESTISGSTANAVLREHGIAVRSDEYVAFAVKHSTVSNKILTGTPWANGWQQQLERLPGSKHISRQRFDGSLLPATALTWNVLFADNEVENV